MLMMTDTLFLTALEKRGVYAIGTKNKKYAERIFIQLINQVSHFANIKTTMSGASYKMTLPNGSEIYSITMPDDAVGKTYDAYAIDFATREVEMAIKARCR